MEFAAALGERALFPPEEIAAPRAVALSSIAEEAIGRGERADIASLEPVYLRGF
jgi:hypothetical protein